MKLYQKYINGELVILPSVNIVIYKDDTQTISPTEEMILDDGWEVYNSDKQNNGKLLLDVDEEKEVMLETINEYDKSSAVNMFYLNQHPIWLDKLTRMSLKLRFESEANNNFTHTTIWYDGMSHQILISDGIKMLSDIELYASRCYDNTQNHIKEINNSNDVEFIKNYDYTYGYPQKLTFNFQ